MKEKFKLYDPISLKIFTIDFNQLRFLIDSNTLLEQLKINIEKKENFSNLDDQPKGELLNLLNLYKTKIPYNSRETLWPGIPGLNLNMELFIDYIPSNEIFFDKIAYNTETKLFYKNILNKYNSYAHLEIKNKINMTTPATLLLKDNFISYEKLDPIEKLPIFDNYKGPDSENITRILLDKDANIKPIKFQIPIYSKDSWVIYLGVNIETNLKPNGVLWNKIIKDKALYDFFYNIGYKPKGDGLTRTIWIHEQKGNIIEFNESPYHKPFMLIKQANFKTDPYSRRKLGDLLLEDMNKKNVYEKNCFNSGNIHLKNALNILKTKNKYFVLEHLKYAKEDYSNCKNTLRIQAVVEKTFVLWLETLISDKTGDYLYRNTSYVNILEIMANNNNWEFIAWFLQDLRNSNIFDIEFIRNLPLHDSAKNKLIEPNNLRIILDYWETCYKKAKYNSKNTSNSKNGFIFEYFKESHFFQYFDIEAKLLKTIMNNTIKTKTDTQWLLQSTNNLNIFEIILQNNLIKNYIQCLTIGINNLEHAKKHIDLKTIPEMETEYKWQMVENNLNQIKLMNKLFLSLNAINNFENLEEKEKFCNKIINLLNNFNLFYENNGQYNDYQLNFIFEILNKTYKTIRHMELHPQLQELKLIINNCFKDYFSFTNYKIIQNIFTIEEKENYFEEILTSINNKETNFITKKMQIAYTYISINKFKLAEKNILFITKTEKAKNNIHIYKELKNIEKFYNSKKNFYSTIDPRITAYFNLEKKYIHNTKQEIMKYNNNLIARINTTVSIY